MIKTKLKKWRTRSKLSQEAAAKMIKIPVGTYRDWEQGRSNPSPFTTAALLEKIKL